MINQQLHRDFISILDKNSSRPNRQKIGRYKAVTRNSKKIYDSKRDGIEDKGFVVTVGSLYMSIYPLADPDSTINHVLLPGSWVFSEFFNILRRMNYGVLIISNAQMTKYYDFIDSEFQEWALQSPGTASLLFSQSLQTLSVMIGNKSLGEYTVSKTKNVPIEENLTYARVLSEYLQGCGSEVTDIWMPTTTGPQYVYTHAGIKTRTVNLYVSDLMKAGYLKKNKDGETLINIKKSMEFIEGKPCSSIKSSMKIEDLKTKLHYLK